MIAKKTKSVRAPSPVKTDPPPWPFVEVRWHDATSESNWKHKDDLPNVSCIVTRGWLVRIDKVCITIAASIGMIDAKEGGIGEDVGEIITIPKGCVVPGGMFELDAKPRRSRKVTLN